MRTVFTADLHSRAASGRGVSNLRQSIVNPSTLIEAGGAWDYTTGSAHPSASRRLTAKPSVLQSLECLQCIGCEIELCCSEVVTKMLHARRAGNEQNVRRASQ